MFLAVADHGSTLAASRVLRVSQTTVSRRVEALERALEVRLFERRAAGYRLTEAGTSVVPAARRLAEAAAAIETVARSRARTLAGTVRLTTEEVFAVTLLPPLLREIRERFPDIRLELDTSRELRDLAGGEADIALRSTSQEAPEGMVGRALTRDDWMLYCSQGYAETHGIPMKPEDLRGHNIVGGGGSGLWRAYSAWLAKLGLQEQVGMHYDSSGGLLSAVKAGIGIAVLPCIVADSDPDFVLCVPLKTDHKRVMWLLTHERVRQDAAVRAVVDFLYDALSAHVRKVEALRAERASR